MKQQKSPHPYFPCHTYSLSSCTGVGLGNKPNTCCTYTQTLSPWLQGEIKILLIFFSPNIISHAILLTVEEVLKPLSLHNIYAVISEEYMPATNRNVGLQSSRWRGKRKK